MSEITRPVGKGAPNLPQDVTTVQTLINDNVRKLAGVEPLKVDGIAGKKTLAAIEAFQKQVAKLPKPDVKVDPGGRTWGELVKVGCDLPQENFPYDADTFKLINQYAPDIRKYSQKFNVPPVAVAGSIADEYNTRRGMRVPVDWIQDNFYVQIFPNIDFRRDAILGSSSKALNLTKHDVGHGNIKIETAHQIYNEYLHTFPDYQMDYTDIVDYVLTDTGTVHVATLVVKKGQQELKPYAQGISEEKAEGLYVTYYKQGPSYVTRYRNALAQDPTHRMSPARDAA